MRTAHRVYYISYRTSRTTNIIESKRSTAAREAFIAYIFCAQYGEQGEVDAEMRDGRLGIRGAQHTLASYTVTKASSSNLISRLLADRLRNSVAAIFPC